MEDTRNCSVMAHKEVSIQRALGILNDWIIIVYNPDLPPVNFHQNPWRKGNEHLVVIEALNCEHARQLIKDAHIFPDTWNIQGGWQSNIAGEIYRKEVRTKYMRSWGQAQIHVISRGGTPLDRRHNG